MQHIVLRQEQKIISYKEYELKNLYITKNNIAKEIEKFEKNYLDLENIVDSKYQYIFAKLSLHYCVES